MSHNLPDSRSVHAVAKDPEEATHCNLPDGILQMVVDFRNAPQSVQFGRALLEDSLEICTDVGYSNRTSNAGGDLHES
jgi:hypothetical protein